MNRHRAMRRQTDRTHVRNASVQWRRLRLRFGVLERVRTGDASGDRLGRRLRRRLGPGLSPRAAIRCSRTACDEGQGSAWPDFHAGGSPPGQRPENRYAIAPMKKTSNAAAGAEPISSMPAMPDDDARVAEEPGQQADPHRVQADQDQADVERELRRDVERLQHRQRRAAGQVVRLRVGLDALGREIDGPLPRAGMRR